MSVRFAILWSVPCWALVAAVAVWGVPVVMMLALAAIFGAVYRVNLALDQIDRYVLAGEDAAMWCRVAMVAGVVFMLSVCAL